MITKKVILASKSPRRKFLLEQADIHFRIVTQDTDETFDPDMDVYKVAEFLACLKGDAVYSQISKDEIIIAADTIVISPTKEVMGKPTNADDAQRILSDLSNAPHEVVTGVSMMSIDKCESFSVISTVYFDQLTEEEIDYYIEKYRPFDKAGAYGIQEWIGWCKIKKIEGSYSNIMGLPMHEVYNALRIF